MLFIKPLQISKDLGSKKAPISRTSFLIPPHSPSPVSTTHLYFASPPAPLHYSPILGLAHLDAVEPPSARTPVHCSLHFVVNVLPFCLGLELEGSGSPVCTFLLNSFALYIVPELLVAGAGVGLTFRWYVMVTCCCHDNTLLQTELP